MRAWNPFAFRPGQVVFWTTGIYLAVIISLIYVQESLPSAPSQDRLPQGVNLTEAWSDLQAITRHYHPYNSHENDVVRQYLMRRSKEILERNGVKYSIDLTGGVPWESSYTPFGSERVADHATPAVVPPGATIFDDQISNVTYATKNSNVAQYFEGNNFYVYIHGSEDPEGDWWRSENFERSARQGAGVLVNCHFDSVATGYGATDDGMSCISLLQILSHFTSEGRQPRKGVVLLFNNAEEDGLLGAQAFGYSPLVQFCHTFVNLEGAGAGGRAMLFRTTDLESAKAYSRSPHPFGSVVAANAFERGVIKSGTDYSVFVDNFGQRGLDIAFYAPRARYHTEEDDARHTSVDSIWHMLSAALASTDALVKATDTQFNGPRSDGRKDLVQNGRPTGGVWFDWYGAAWSAFPLRGLFAWSLTLLITTPLTLILVIFLLVRRDKCYFFSKDVSSALEESDDRVSLGGWKGFVRFPFALMFAGALTIGSVFLLAKINPMIIYSSAYSVWAMMFSLFYFASWLILRGAHFVRPSALQRAHAFFWLFIFTWILSVFAAVAEDRMNIGAVYSLAFLHTFVFGALLISLLEQFALPSKQDFALQQDERIENDGPSSNSSNNVISAAGGQANEDADAGDDVATPTETTPLRTGEQGYGANEQTTTFASTYRRSVSEPRPGSSGDNQEFVPYQGEQAWSGRLPSSTWFLQFLLVAPVYLIVLGNLALVQTSSMSMTGSDGSSLLVPLMGVGVLTILLLLPLMPFIHRVNHQVPLFLVAVFIGTLIYNLTAFPFSVNNRFKFFFQEVIDLDEGTNVVGLLGLEEFVRPVVSNLPTAAGQAIRCPLSSVRNGLAECTYDATLLPPDLANGKPLGNLISVEASKAEDGRFVTVKLDALNTRTCFLDTSEPIFGFSVEGGSKRDARFGSFPQDGLSHIQLWRRDWEGAWVVTLDLGDKGHSNGVHEVHQFPQEGAKGDSSDSELKRRAENRNDRPLLVTARCAWSDANEATTIPALHEVKKYMPQWAIVTKKSVGLVEVKKSVTV